MILLRQNDPPSILTACLSELGLPFRMPSYFAERSPAFRQVVDIHIVFLIFSDPCSVRAPATDLSCGGVCPEARLMIFTRCRLRLQQLGWKRLLVKPNPEGQRRNGTA